MSLDSIIIYLAAITLPPSSLWPSRINQSNGDQKSTTAAGMVTTVSERNQGFIIVWISNDYSTVLINPTI